MAYGLIPLINGKSYEWADIVVNILGLPSTTATKIVYEDKQNMKNVKGPGNRVISRIYGDFDSTCTVTFLMEEMENFQKVAPLGIIQNIPEFPIIVTFVDASLTTVIHTINNCRFTTNRREVTRGDGEIECECEMIISHIDWI